MIQDATLLCTLLGNVLQGLTDLARQADNRDYIWRVRLSGHLKQLREYQKIFQSLNQPVFFYVEDSSEVCALPQLELMVSEGYTNMSFVFQYEDLACYKVPMRDITLIRPVLAEQTIPSTLIN